MDRNHRTRSKHLLHCTASAVDTDASLFACRTCYCIAELIETPLPLFDVAFKERFSWLLLRLYLDRLFRELSEVFGIWIQRGFCRDAAAVPKAIFDAAFYPIFFSSSSFLSRLIALSRVFFAFEDGLGGGCGCRGCRRRGCGTWRSVGARRGFARISGGFVEKRIFETAVRRHSLAQT